MPAEPVFEQSFSEDESVVYTGEVEFDGVAYGAILVAVLEPIGDEPEEWEALLLSYMEFLNEEAFMLTSAADAGFGHTLESHAEARGILMYGEDGEIEYAIKGWIDNEMLAVLYVGFSGDMNQNFQTTFLNGFRFPGD